MAGGDGFGGRDLPGDPFGAPWEGLDEDALASKKEPAPDPLGGSSGRILGDPFDGLGGDVGDLPGLELDEPALPSQRPAPRTSTPAPRPNAPGRPATGTVDSSGTLPSPAERLTDPHVLREVLDLADYGPAPAGIFGAVPYAVLVLTRQQALRKDLKGLHRLRGRARTDAEEALVELGRALHARKDEAPVAGLGALVTVADRAGEVAGQKSEEWEQARQVADAQRTSLEAKIAEIDKKAGPYRDRETKLATQMNVRENDLRRATARLQRVEIELRNAGGGEAPDEARVQLLTAEREARAADTATAQGHVDELAPQLSEARRELAVMLQALNDLESQRRAVDQAQNRSEKKHLSTASAAEREYHAAVIELATEALARGVADEVCPEPAKQTRLMVSARTAREREVDLHEAALKAFDKPSFQKGLAILGGAALVIVAMLLFVILR